tara:strand:+ start:715 stop:1173 length:459 start_codon:yes stop_codon:yes gene_type:complete
MSRAFRADRERQVYMGDATHRKPTANKPKQGDMKMKIEHTNYEDMTKKELKYLCEMAGHKRSGTKAQLLHRLEYHAVGDMKTETPKYNNESIAMIENALDLAITELKELRKKMVATEQRIALANKTLHSRADTNCDLAYMICAAIDALEVVE